MTINIDVTSFLLGIPVGVLLLAVVASSILAVNNYLKGTKK